MNTGGKGFTSEQIKALQTLNSKELVPCTYPWIRLTEKDVTGEYTFCAWLDKDIGTVDKENTSRLLDVWNSPKALQIRQDLLEGNRSSCHRDCKVAHFPLDTFLGYEDWEYEAFEAPFLDNLQQAVADLANRRAESTAKPLSLALFPTNVCNIRCRMCKMEKRYDGEVDPCYFEGIKPLLPFLHELFVAGGEPFFCKSSRNIIFSDAVKSQRHLYLSTISNGTVLTEAVLEKLADLRLGRVIFSLDGVTPEVYNAVRRGADFEKVLVNIKRFVAHRDAGRLKVKITGSNFVIQALNYRQIEGYVELCHSLGIRASCNLVFGTSELAPHMDDVQQNVAKALERAVALDMDYTATSLQTVLEKLPAYRNRVRKLARMQQVFGERNTARIRGVFDRHETIKSVVKKFISA
ncbi:Radical SAM domain protein [Solidesulfovibrio carbinoliphilus subsp. oakridgensis]|uniref:Radical SAM domain protein n=1 Tax=Solidesulfovibrio carbinoliphilus subsp. oakridgensis TaxID=694327 RepID=G7Q7R1_9BACT|nr:radical SAM protein [Solidesulfovibrio carbinoliphilus]EHJ47370.1 Radical SAM domain protein [Solidesulfovibrio carbinoliphilus subsp. oakridgensis]